MGLRNELEVERVFTYGVALEQGGTQKNAVFCWENIIYIMNSDKTILLRFETSVNEFSRVAILPESEAISSSSLASFCSVTDIWASARATLLV